MTQTNLFPVAREGWKYIGYSLAFALLFSIFDFEILAFIALLKAVFFIFVFRNPERDLPSFEELSFVAPCDGVVRSIEELKDSEYAYKIEIEGSYKDVALLRAPATAKVESTSSFNGTRVSKLSKLFKSLNENTRFTFETKESNKFALEHRVKNSFFKIIAELIPAQKMTQASRYGVLINGVTTIYLPSNFRVNVSVGNEIKASESLIGYFS